jgi:peptide-methionine (R)-S-oxide reductase
MNRRTLLSALGASPLLALVPVPSLADAKPPPFEPLDKSPAAWREILPGERFRILFEAATEPAFSSTLNEEKRPGVYICAACRLPLFDAEHKFDSGTGWPSFTQPIPGTVETSLDFKLIWPRTEYHCARCGGHQGHLFDDGPKPRGERWCNNGLALEFVPEGRPLPELRT